MPVTSDQTPARTEPTDTAVPSLLQRLARNALVEAAYSGNVPSLRQVLRHEIPSLPAVDLEQSPTRIERPGDYNMSMRVDGRDRSYSVHVPPGYAPDRPMPVMVLLHGVGDTGATIADVTRMKEKADKEGFVLVCPNGTQLLGRAGLSFWDVPNWPLPEGIPRVSDTQFIAAVVDRSLAQMNIDPKRVYLVGHSNGGMLAYALASRYPDKFAAIAVVNAAMTGREQAPQKPVSVLSIRGVLDPVVPIVGLPNRIGEIDLPRMDSWNNSMEFWRRGNGITSEATQTTTTAGRVISYRDNTSGVQVEQHLLSDAGHPWPGGRRSQSTFNATDAIWSFLSAQRRR